MGVNGGELEEEFPDERVDRTEPIPARWDAELFGGLKLKIAQAVHADTWTEPGTVPGLTDDPEWHHRFRWWQCVAIADLVVPALSLLTLHHPVPEQMLDEEACIAENAEVLVDVMVCAHCCHLAHPDGCEDYYDPDVFWPCPTARACGVSK